jgi:hypothetical protein
MPPSSSELLQIITTLQSYYHTSVGELFITLLRSSSPEHTDAVKSILTNGEVIMNLLCNHPSQDEPSALGIYKATHQRYHNELDKLNEPELGWHFNATKASAKQIETWDLGDMARQFQSIAPGLWSLVHGLLDAGVDGDPSTSEDVGVEGDEAAYWLELDDAEVSVKDIPDARESDNEEEQLETRGNEQEQAKKKKHKRRPSRWAMVIAVSLVFH